MQPRPAMIQLEIAPGVRLSVHAAVQIPDRKIELGYVLEVLRKPEFVRDDWRHPGVKLAFGRIVQFGNRWMRVAYAEKSDGIVVVTAMWDRKAENWR